MLTQIAISSHWFARTCTIQRRKMCSAAFHCFIVQQNFKLMPNTRSRFTVRRLAIFAAVLVAIVLAWRYYSTDQVASVSYRSVPLERGDVVVTVSATGSLTALSTIDIGTQVSGLVLEVNADFNDEVTKDQVIARIDPANFKARLTQARADLASARAGLQEAQANLKNAQADFVRKTELVGRQLVSRSELDVSLAARDQSRARVSSARASIQQRQAGVANAELDLTYTDIRSPVDGVVLLRQVEPGQTVAASFQTPVLFQIAEDLQEMQIELSVDESDVGQIRSGQPVTFGVDAFPGRKYQGDVRQVRLAATNTQNVITYPVVIDVSNTDLSLLPGMTASATIEVAERQGVWRVPNAALRFKPAGIEAPRRGRRSMNFDDLVDSMQLTAQQRAAYDTDAKAIAERWAQRRAERGGRPSGGQGGPPAGGSRPSPEQIAKRVQSGYGSFRESLTAAQREAFDSGMVDQLSARWAMLWLAGEEQPSAMQIRVGISDATHTEVINRELVDGLAVLTGIDRSSR